ncbi:MAG: lytic murein transglycosylase B [Steroidobacterales bacterium]
MRAAALLLVFGLSWALAAGDPAVGEPAAAPAPPVTPATPAAPSPTVPAQAPSIQAPIQSPPLQLQPLIEHGHFDLTRPEIQAFIDQLVTLGLDRSSVTAVLGAAEAQPKIIEAMDRPAEKTLQWWEYRARMLTPLRIDAGVQLWRDHKELLDQIAIEYQVPPEYLLAVLGVETQYGRTTGRYRVIDALTTLSFDYPPRASYFRKELSEYLLLAREDGFDPLNVRGSYAGAMGALQFMPSSYRRYAVSAQHAAHRDLWNDWADIFASVANYLHQYGWQYGAPVLADAQLLGTASLTPPEHVALNDTLGSLRARGLSIDTTLPDSTPALLLAAPQQDGMGYRVGFQNFYVITRYNTSPLYAMAVHDLAQAIKQQVQREAAL